MRLFTPASENAELRSGRYVSENLEMGKVGHTLRKTNVKATPHHEHHVRMLRVDFRSDLNHKPFPNSNPFRGFVQ